ncbi:MAG: sigma-70 family RNA polymerase sigma factor [Flavobacteriales bacterium]|nr:sigma-70 family RNA polymerase sigma factor [Flavobacteriales bacterium]MCB9334752.1 sigma-70 family RNA polymerase sigma factor [Flavobacteriales bacterium]
MNNYNDKELMQMFREENSRNYAFSLIVQQFQERLYWHIRRMVINHDDADDITQNTFIKAWKGLDNFKEDAQLFTWLYRIATNESITFLNKKRKLLFIPIKDIEKDLSNQLEDDEYFTGDEIQLKLQKALLTLPEKQRLVFNMKYFDELKYEEMAEILNTSVGALKASYHHAVKKIDTFLRED